MEKETKLDRYMSAKAVNLLAAYFSDLGKKGGAAGKGKSKARTREQAQAAARARWDKKKK